MPIAPFWSILFFIMLFTLGVDSQFAMMETVVTAIVDEFPVLKKGRRKIAVVGVLCIVMFLLGVPQCSLVSPLTTELFFTFSRSFRSELLYWTRKGSPSATNVVRVFFFVFFCYQIFENFPKALSIRN